jgi:hypothetical protein
MDDYGKLKIARLRLDFARHALLTLLNEASCKGVRWQENEAFRNIFSQNGNDKYSDC